MIKGMNTENIMFRYKPHSTSFNGILLVLQIGTKVRDFDAPLGGSRIVWRNATIEDLTTQDYTPQQGVLNGSY